MAHKNIMKHALKRMAERGECMIVRRAFVGWVETKDAAQEADRRYECNPLHCNLPPPPLIILITHFFR